MKKILFCSMMAALVCAACHKRSFNEVVAAEVEQFNKKEAPKRLDQCTTFDSMAYDMDTQTLSYYYTIEGQLDGELFPVDLVKEELQKNLTSSIQLKAHKAHGLNFHYKYLSKQSGEPIVECTFTKEDYQTVW